MAGRGLSSVPTIENVPLRYISWPAYRSSTCSVAIEVTSSSKPLTDSDVRGMRFAKTVRLSSGACISLRETRNASCSRAVRYTVEPTLIVTATSMPMNTLDRSFHSSRSRLDTSRALVSLSIWGSLYRMRRAARCFPSIDSIGHPRRSLFPLQAAAPPPGA